MRVVVAILVFLMAASNIRLLSQTITGTVLDAKKRKPIADCIVILKGNTVTAITDEKGSFSLAVPAGLKKPSLVFSQIGYNTAEFSLLPGKDTFFLSPKDILLKEIEIVAQKKVVLNPQSTETLLDFDFLQDDIVLLVAGAEGNALKLMNDHGDVITKLRVNKNTSRLKRDCLGNLQLFSADSTWQVFYDYEKLNTLNPYALQQYEAVLGSCVCADKGRYYFRDIRYRNLRTNYYFFSEQEKGRRQELVSFGDTAKIRSFELDYNLQYFLDVRRKSNYTQYNEPVDSIKKKMERYREELALDWQYLSWLGSMETEMVRNDSGLFIVNFTDTLIYRIGQDNVKPLCRLDAACGKKHLLSKVYSDPVYGQNYLFQFNNSRLWLTRFDMHSGKEVFRSGIPNVPYLPEKIIVMAGKVYFIQKNLADDQPYKLIRYYLN